jgi:hypothetical protein
MKPIFLNTYCSERVKHYIFGRKLNICACGVLHCFDRLSDRTPTSNPVLSRSRSILCQLLLPSPFTILTFVALNTPWGIFKLDPFPKTTGGATTPVFVERVLMACQWSRQSVCNCACHYSSMRHWAGTNEAGAKRNQIQSGRGDSG